MEEFRLLLLKTDLGIMRADAAQETYLKGLLAQAEAYLSREGVRLECGKESDDVFAASMAAWMYRSRANTGETRLPNHLRQEIRDRRVGKILRGDSK